MSTVTVEGKIHDVAPLDFGMVAHVVNNTATLIREITHRTPEEIARTMVKALRDDFKAIDISEAEIVRIGALLGKLAIERARTSTQPKARCA